MGEPLSISILRKKRDQVRTMVAAYEAKLKEAQVDLAHINATLRLFEAAGEPSDFPAYVDLNRVFRRGETTRICLEALRNEGPLDTREIGLRVLRAKGIDETDVILRNGVNFRVIHALTRSEKRGLIVKIGKSKRAFVWRIRE